MRIEGKNAVYELLKSGTTVNKVLIQKEETGKIVALAKQLGVKIQFVDKKVLDKESVTGKHQGYIAEAVDFEYCDLDDLLNKEGDKLIVVLDEINDPHNLGSIIRVAECAGADGVVIPKSGSASVTESVIRISAGAAEHMKVAKVPNLNQAVEKLQKAGYWVYALEAGGEDIYKEKFEGNVALIVGGEDSGVKRLTKEKCDKILSIPLQGNVNSLNASVALGIAAYEVVRNRLK